MKKSKKIFILCIFIIFIILCIVIGCYLRNYIFYKKITSIIENAKEQALTINNVKIEINPIVDGKEENNGTVIVIKDNMQCNTIDRKYNEENNIPYQIIDMNENIYYTIEPYDDKKIYINDVDSEELLHIELLDCIIVPEISFIDSYKYNVEDDVIDGKECYKISIYNNKENYEYNCWISKENGLVLKEYMRTYWDLIESEEKEENIEETKINYYFDVVTDDDVKKIDFSEYSDYEIVDNTK